MKKVHVWFLSIFLSIISINTAVTTDVKEEVEAKYVSQHCIDNVQYSSGTLGKVGILSGLLGADQMRRAVAEFKKPTIRNYRIGVAFCSFLCTYYSLKSWMSLSNEVKELGVAKKPFFNVYYRESGSDTDVLQPPRDLYSISSSVDAIETTSLISRNIGSLSLLLGTFETYFVTKHFKNSFSFKNHRTNINGLAPFAILCLSSYYLLNTYGNLSHQAEELRDIEDNNHNIVQKLEEGFTVKWKTKDLPYAEWPTTQGMPETNME